ncbi:MAG: UDP-N-acetylmuramoyl-L-alanyl-D-glutamate--2,6-diaminopimelate ligase [Porphyromonadaceae bacterium]|nr:UDP-N-acetylmuramoyl-L-alanyl-D-glutamate--2,6-diaminopimelate ligase [Porphyromonadaceae bacterium]
MLLTELLKATTARRLEPEQIPYELIGSAEGVQLTTLTEDSRQVTHGTIFVAVRGVAVDGHNYIDKAIASGAKVVVTQERPEAPTPSVCYVLTPDSREMLGRMASAWHGHPSQSLRVVGVTGTNGKTTIATLLYRLYMSAGYPTGLISTVRNYVGTEAIDTTHTTPGALELQALLARMRDAGCAFVFMEVSSHAVEQRRIAGLAFEGGVFTNLTRDHLDYHGTLKEYLYAKKRFFDLLPSEAFALSNADDRNGEVMLQNTLARRKLYALNTLADFKGRILEQYADSTLLELDGQEVSVRLVGAFNAYNLLAVYATAHLLGMPKDEILRYLSALTSVDGRLEALRSEKRGYTAFVDYAHTPDALSNVLQTLDDLRQGARQREARIICVVGCGGDRDRGKRPLMAAEALRYADYIILTSDNPRTEDPEAILDEMQAGVSEGDEYRTRRITDRAEAIREACSMAQPHDLVLIAGKGHETYQEIQGVRHPFDDREIIRQQFATE